ncbi:MAG: haloalkane dehalogenase [Coxiella sp. RIFCSPHIGHO2_12_FULL_42_15]|nr:MAG: haloalkane dehalogenase [Coxiella sp. RIFCSPHIGHO2_12_FULL_42_15]
MSESHPIISAECHLPSHAVMVHGSQMHYLQAGSGDPILFVHGMPTYSYLWRNVIPHLSELGCCIALDLIGMGQSEKPNIEYTIFDHIRYFEGFIEALKLKNITLVLHGWGSVIGFDYASRHADNIKALAFYESHLQPNVDWEMLSLPVQQLATLLNRPGASYRAIVEHNYLIKKLLPHGVLRKLTAEEIRNYERPFLTPASRKPLWQYILELPLGNGNSQVVQLIKRYSQWLQKTKLPKLLLYGIPGFTTTIESVQWAKQHLPNLTLVELFDSLHFAQETDPEGFSAALKGWLNTI